MNFDIAKEYTKKDFQELTIKLFGNKNLTKKTGEEWYSAKDLVGLGFNPVKNDGGKREGILILGLNPSGSINSANSENGENTIFLNTVEGFEKNDENIKKRTNFRYFSPIAKLFDNAGIKTKWDWANIKNIEEELKKDLPYNQIEIKKIISTYNKDSDCTIYIGDLFYIHETHSGELDNWLDKINADDIKDYLVKSIGMHITALYKNNIDIKFIYINNSNASKRILKAFNMTITTHLNVTFNNKITIPIFFGGMLSNGVTDEFAKARLVNEIKEVCGI